MLNIEYQNPKNRLFCFILALLLSLTVIEFIVRNNTSIFESASNKLLLKVALFEKKDKVDFLFLGTSRTQDGVSPQLISHKLKEISPVYQTVSFNGAAPGSNSADLLNIVQRYTQNKALRFVLIELSAAHLGEGKSSKPSPPTVESSLAHHLENLAFIRYRTAFIIENLARFPTLLLFSSSLTGDEVKVSEQLRAWRGQKEPLPSHFTSDIWTPQIISPSSHAIAINSELENFVNRMSVLAKVFAKSGVKVIFVVPPLSVNYQPAPERDSFQPLYAELAHRTQAEIWNFTTSSIPDSFFKDPSHLNKDGRGHWSYSLAQQLAKKLESH